MGLERMIFLVILTTFALSFRVLARETVWDAARIAHELIEDSVDAVATMATIYPSNHSISPNEPFALQEYYASCYHNGSLTLLFLPISRHSQNILQSPHRAASITIASQNPAAKKPRIALVGNVTIFRDRRAADEAAIKRCYLAKHPDARWWLPDDDDAAHLSYWARFDPQTVYFVGGFGDKHYIGYIPLEIFRNTSLASNSIYESEHNSEYSSTLPQVLIEQDY
ncbi:hypothetical protein HGRIS_002512 [Hohenbuehelia grisea]|uniref:CREG-like beta-barrel domain-containing protein n=1 Tax=Hohenbuehelia grisea TaxID=104357 RepID=A0ABR3JL79_9AGAR